MNAARNARKPRPLATILAALGAAGLAGSVGVARAAETELQGYLDTCQAYAAVEANEQAVSCFDALLAMYPASHAARSGRAAALAAKSGRAKSEPDATPAGRDGNVEVNGYLDYCAAYAASGAIEHAISCYDAVIALYPASKAARVQREALIAESGRPVRPPAANVEVPKEAPPLPAVVDTSAVAAPTSERRVALVIGNAGYKSVGLLKNPGNDADLMARTLESVGFEVTKVIDADQAAMKRAMLDFGRKLRDGVDVGLFYYSGHGVQANGSNYLIPVTAAIRDQEEIAIESVDMNDFLRTMENARSRVNIVILDACRDNPFGTGFKSTSRGLSMVAAPSGTYIAFSTAPGQVAEDGDGDNSTYTKALAEAMQKPGIPLEGTFKEVRRLVRRATGDRQVTWDSSSITGEFYFRPPAN